MSSSASLPIVVRARGDVVRMQWVGVGHIGGAEGACGYADWRPAPRLLFPPGATSRLGRGRVARWVHGSFRLPSVVNRCQRWLSFGGEGSVVASVLRVREVADPKCR